jgi:hypothetical protein
MYNLAGHLLITFREDVNKNGTLSLISFKLRQTVCKKFHPHRKPTDPYKARFPEFHATD